MEGFDIIITKDGDQMYAQLTGQQKVEIFPEAEDKFFYRAVEAKITFERNENGEVTGLQFDQGQVHIKAERTADQPEEKKEVQVDPKILESYVGEYELMPGFIINISVDGEHIYSQATGQAKFEIFPSSETEFFYKVVEAQITFVKSDEGEVTGMLLKQGGQELPASKVK